MSSEKTRSSLLFSALELWKETKPEIHMKIKTEGSSMSPLIRAGDIISLRFAGFKHLKKGDIIAFRKDENLIVHRLLKKRRVNGKGWLCQQGDNLSGRSWIPEEKLLGKVESIQSTGRTLNMARWPWTWINPTLGFTVSFWTTVQENMRALKILIFGHQPVPVLSGLNKGLSKIINRMYIFIVMKAMAR
ncbi:MAG: hypothetical protein IMF11_01275 [Proteobacteria bacterium]|nr:hypothetical protein [Pseudomonadota bacterium]